MIWSIGVVFCLFCPTFLSETSLKNPSRVAPLNESGKHPLSLNMFYTWVACTRASEL